mgnify:CR=1 FL=1
MPVIASSTVPTRCEPLQAAARGGMGVAALPCYLGDPDPELAEQRQRSRAIVAMIERPGRHRTLAGVRGRRSSEETADASP